MELITILNRCHHFPAIVYHRARFSPDSKSILVSIHRHRWRWNIGGWLMKPKT